MNTTTRAAVAVVGGLAFFLGIVGFALFLAQYNATATPNLLWFPIVVWGALFSLVFWINSKWDIGLALPDGKPWGLIAAFAVVSMIASHCVLILEGAFHGISREFEAAPAGVSPLFAFVYWIGIVVAMSTASESAFRGIMQSKLAPLFGVWPAILIATFVNWAAHRWEGLLERTVGVVAILIAWGYLRHLSGSLTPTILTHIGAILVWDMILWTWAPWDHGTMGIASLATTAVIGVLTFATSIYLARQINARA